MGSSRDRYMSYEGFCLADRVEALPFEGWKELLRPLARAHGPRIDAGIRDHLDRYGDQVPILPRSADAVLRAFSYFDLPDTRVVIIGQDCYPNPEDAMGLCFSVPSAVTSDDGDGDDKKKTTRRRRLPPSLLNILKEVQRERAAEREAAEGDPEETRQQQQQQTTPEPESDDISREVSAGDLSPWARQGVLLLNTALTVRASCPGSHLPLWAAFTHDVVREIARRARTTTQRGEGDKNGKGVCFLLWGAHAAAYEDCIVDGEKQKNNDDSGAVLVLKHSHPSPLSRRPFVGCGHFGGANAFLRERAGKPPVRWW